MKIYHNTPLIFSATYGIMCRDISQERMIMGNEVHSKASLEIAEAIVRAIEAKWGDVFCKLAILPRIRTAADATRRDVALMLHKIDGDTVEAAGGFECCTLRGTKRAQFMRLCEIKKANPDYPTRRCARMALVEIRSEEGYTDIDALGEYAAMHRSWWKVSTRKGQTTHEEGKA